MIGAPAFQLLLQQLQPLTVIHVVAIAQQMEAIPIQQQIHTAYALQDQDIIEFA